MRERKLRSTAESLVRFKGSRITYTYYIYKIKRKVKSKNTMRICSLSVPRLKDEWNQTVWSVNNLRCGTAGCHEDCCQEAKFNAATFSPQRHRRQIVSTARAGRSAIPTFRSLLR